MPVANTNWEIVVNGARWELSLDAGKYSPPHGYIYLIVDVTFRNLASAKETEFSENDIVLMVDGLPIHDEPMLWLHPDGEGHNVNEKGEIVKADGAGSGSSYDLGVNDVYYSKDHGSGHDLEGREVHYSFAEAEEQQRSIVFMLKLLENVNAGIRNFRFVFKDLPPVLFTPDRFTGNCAPYCDIDK